MVDNCVVRGVDAAAASVEIQRRCTGGVKRVTTTGEVYKRGDGNIDARRVDASFGQPTVYLLNVVVGVALGCCILRIPRRIENQRKKIAR